MADNKRGYYRAIYTSIWDDPDFRQLTPVEKLVLLNLRTSPLSNMPVIFPYYIEAIQRQTGLSDESIHGALDTLCHTHWIAIQEGIVWVRNGLKFDPAISLDNPKHRKAVINSLQSLPKIKIIKDFCDYYQIELPYHIPNGIPYPIPYAIQEKEKEKEKEKKEAAEKPVDNSPDNRPSAAPSKEYFTDEQYKRLDLLYRSLLEKRKDFRTFAFVSWCKKKRAHPEAIILALRRLNDDYLSIAKPWPWCCEIAGVESGNFNERDFIAAREKEGDIFQDILKRIGKSYRPSNDEVS